MASVLPVYEVKGISLLLLGKTGHGKSSTGNTILGWEAFEKSDYAFSETTKSKMHSSNREDGTVLRIVDTPGVMDTHISKELIIAKIMEGMSFCPNGFDALVFVIKYGIRYTREEIETLEILRKNFGKTFIRDFGVVVLTHGDSFDLNHEKDRLTFESWLTAYQREEQSGPFDELLHECGNRCVLFYNYGEKYIDKTKQAVQKLLTLVKEMSKVYTSQQLELAWTTREELAKRLGVPLLYKEVLEKLSLLMEQIAKDIRNNTFSYSFMLNKIETLNEEVDDVGKEFRATFEFSLLKKSINSILPRVKAIQIIEEREKQKEEQERLLMYLKTLTEPPESFQMFLNETFLNIAKKIIIFSKWVTLDKYDSLKMVYQRLDDSLKKLKASYEYQKKMHEYNKKIQEGSHKSFQ